MARLELENVRKEYSPRVVPVKDISFQVDDGEFLTLLGPSGCGKSTLLRLIAGLEIPTRGRISIGDRSIVKVPPAELNVAMVFQSYALYPHMTVRDNIAAALKLRRYKPDLIENRVREVARTLAIEEILPRKPRQLSGGQRQRVALARAIVRQPDLFLLDEPLSNLDALLREQVRAELKQLFQKENRPVVYVTHDQTEAMSLSTKIAVLDDGFIQQYGTPDEIYRYPANQFVAGFVGTPRMNFLELSRSWNRIHLGDATLPLPVVDPLPERIVLGIRPEDISLVPVPGGIEIGGRIILEERLGKEKLLTVMVGEGECLKVLAPIDRPLEGDNISLFLMEDRIHRFAPDSSRTRL